MGRGDMNGNHLQLSDPRISRSCAAIIAQNGRFVLEDRGHRHGVFINGVRVESRPLEAGDVITFGFADSFKLTFRRALPDTSIQAMLTRIGTISDDSSAGGLGKLKLLLEATSLLHSNLPLDAALGTMLDHAISITGADRGLLLEADPTGSMSVRLARRAGCMSLARESVTPSQTALRQAMAQKSSIITEDLNRADLELQAAQSIIAQSLRAVVAIPLYATSRATSPESTVPNGRGQFLGMLYLDSRRPAAFSKLDRQILDALAVESASILDNARLVERERERQRMEQELNIARDIQQALLPRGFRDFPYLAVTGIHSPCHAVGGDYFDVFPLNDGRTAILIADVSGKGLGAALLTTMLQGALSGMHTGGNPIAVFNYINRFLCDHAEVGRYATMFFGVLGGEGQLEFINAGHPSPMLLRRGKVMELFTEGSFPIGLIPEATYSASEVKLEPGDTLALFSDGITEAVDPAEELFGTSRLRDTLMDQHNSPLDSLQKTVLESVQRFARGASQADDMTLLLVRYRAAPQAASTAS